MKQLLILLLLFFALNCRAQTLTFHRDSTAGGLTYVNALATDSANSFYNLPVKVHITITDIGDNVQGAAFTFSVYSISAIRCIMVFSGVIPVQGSLYTNWDANNDSDTYIITQQALLTKGIYLTFEN